MAIHNEIGEKGEALAKAFLEKKGYEILSTNYRFKKLEIDIIAIYQNQLVVVEVKTRQSPYLAGPEDTVSKTKQKGIVKCANNYITENEIDIDTRFDIISVILNQKGTKIEHIEDAFYPTV
ncbi:MAG: YraN family protein [Putridiphycobacter sp.]|nr:YraN family protein [Putridiphycobacter sp.]